ncbi:MAG TPA: decaprenyl-phosphate phosphoribosyltransferase [Anaerolineaceae bacterium]
MLKAIIKTMRPKQWTKNVFLLAAIIFDRQLFNLGALLHTILGLTLFCLISSVVYIINDIVDAEADRQHPTKRNRPIPSGKLPVPIAISVVVVLLIAIFPIAYWISPPFTAILAAYFVINLLYSFWLKHIPIIDILIIASGFVLRVGAGVTLIDVQRFSPWLYVAMTLLALYMGFGKRRAELVLLAGEAYSHRKVLDGYTIPFLDQLIIIVSSTTIVAYSLYTFSAENLPGNHLTMLTIPFVLYAIFRYLYLIQVKKEVGAPDELVLTDRPLQAAIILYGIAIFVIFYLV